MDIGAAENRGATLNMEVEGSSDEGEGGGRMLTLEATGFQTQEAETGGTMLFDVHNGFNELIRLAMLWTVQQR